MTFTKTTGASDSQPVNIQDDLPENEWVDITGCNVSRWVFAHELDSWQSLPRDSVCDRMRNFPQLVDFQEDRLVYLGFSLLGLIYGGLHCAAWNAPFTTNVEALLWRISSVAASSAGILLPLLWEFSSKDQHTQDFGKLLGFVMKWAEEKVGVIRIYSKRCERGPKRWLAVTAWIIVRYFYIVARFLILFVRLAFFFGFILLYCVARVYLVVECFINLAHLPDSAFQVPVWSQYMPHIS